MARTHQPCALHRYHWPRVPLGTTEEHHVWPKYLGGPEKGAKRWVCGNCHAAAHLALTAMVEGLAIPKVSRAQYALAREGFIYWTNNSKGGPRITDPAEHAAWRARLLAA